MSFYGKNFVFDGISSELYGLFCANIDSSGVEISPSTANIEILEDYVTRRETPYFYGVLYNSKLEFPLKFFSETPIHRRLVSDLNKWLFNRGEYKKLEIIQEDMTDIYFNCILTQSNLICVGNKVFGFECVVTCDSPWAWEREFVFKKNNFTGNVVISNVSDNPRYTRPKIVIKFPNGQTDFMIKNETDTTQSEMIFSSVTSGEVVTIDCDLGLITSNREFIQERFNGRYLSLVMGDNIVSFSGNVESFNLRYIPAKKVGS